MKMSTCYAILLSGGIGNRINSDIPKQYIRAGGRMMISYCLETLINCSRVDGIIVVADDAWRDEIVSDGQQAGLDMAKLIGFADPGRNRQESALNGMEAILQKAGISDVETASDEITVLVHDAARPFLTAEMLDR